MENNVKITFKEKWLVPFGIIKKGNFLRYKTEYVLNSDNAEEVRDFCEKKLVRRTLVGSRFSNNSVEGIHWFWDSGETNIRGEILVKEEVLLCFDKTEDGKIKVTHEEIDHVTCNARYSVEKGFLKTGLIKKFGLAE